MDKTVSKIKVFVFMPTEPPQEYLDKWRESMKRAGINMGKGLEIAIPDFAAYNEKIAQPVIEATQSSPEKPGWINPNYRTKSGRTLNEVIHTAQANIEQGYKKFKEKTERMFETIDGEPNKRFSEMIERWAYDAALRMAQRNLPFIGYQNKIRGVAPFAARWLTGDMTVRLLITNADKEIEGVPILICNVEKISLFRDKLVRRLHQAGARIVKAGFDDEIIQAENNLTNELVNQYLPDLTSGQAGLSDGFAKFATGGESCLDYVVENSLMFLEIVVSQI